MKQLVIVGFGHMGQAFYKGLRAQSNLKITALDRTPGKAKSQDCQLAQLEDLMKANYVLLAVKPQALPDLDIAQLIGPETIIISMLAGTKIKTLKKYFTHNHIVRCMPNLPVKHQAGVIGWYSENLNNSLDQEITEIFNCLGESIQLTNEKLVDKITLISGSGPGYLAYIQTLMKQEAIKLGFTQKQAETIARTTFFGSAICLKETNSELLTAQVSSKGGVTEAIIETMQANGFDQRFSESLQVGFERMTELDKNA